MIMFSTSFLQVDDRGKSPIVDQTTPSSRHHVNLDVILGIYHDRQFLLIQFFAQTIASKIKQCFIYFCCRQGIQFMKHHINTLYSLKSPTVMKDNEISGSAEPLRVIQKTMEKQNEELVLLTLTVPQTQETESKIQLLL